MKTVFIGAGKVGAQCPCAVCLPLPPRRACWAKGRREHRMEFFYRDMRRRHAVLMDNEAPEGGQWNFDADHRETFGARGPGLLPAPVRFAPDATTRDVIGLVERRFTAHPSSLSSFDWPLTPEDAESALQDFIAHRLPLFGLGRRRNVTPSPSA